MNRIIRDALRLEGGEHLTDEAISELGIDLAAGSDHYRAFVGLSAVYDLIGALQLQAIINLVRYFNFYKFERPHQTLDYRTPANLYY